MTTNHLITNKAMKMIQAFLLCTQNPDEQLVKRYLRLQPGKLQADLVKLYLTSFRKLLEQSALGVSTTSVTNTRNNETGYFELNPLQAFYVKAIPAFADECLYYMSDSPTAVATTAIEELGYLLERTLSPYIIESREGTHMIDNLLSHQLLSLLKPLYQAYWPLAAKLLERFFDRINYLKRIRLTPSSPLPKLGASEAQENFALSFTQRFPSVPFALKVLNKLRVVNDVTLNAPIERAMVSLGKGMTVEEFVTILPFDPKQAAEAERTMFGRTEDIEELWSASYTLNVIRRIAFHDSLPFFVQYFFPTIQFCSRSAVEAERSQRAEEAIHWSALITQYWRIAVAFCHYPTEVTNDSFREMAKQLVGLLSQPLFVNTSATAIHVLCDGYYTLSREEEDLLEEYDEGDEAYHEEEFLEEDMRRAEGLSGAGRRPRRIQKDALESDNYFLSMNDPDWNIHHYHNISKDYATQVCQAVFAKYSGNIMPKLCNTFETEPSTAVLMAIQSFSKVCTPAVMATILQGVLDLGTRIAEQSHSTERSKASHVPLNAKRRMVLDIACAVVSELPTENLQKLYNEVIEPVLMDPAPESRQLQKKAYKLLHSMFEHRIKDIFPMLSQIIGLLSIGRQHVTISGIKMRIRCLSWALDACQIYYPDQIVPTVTSLLGEVISFSREKSSETRTMSMEVLERMQRYLTQAGVPVNALLRQIVAGFSSRTPQMIASTIVCMAKVLYLTHDQLPEADLIAAIHLGFQLMESSSLEVRNAAGIFARMTLGLAKRSPIMHKAVNAELQKLLFAIALITTQKHVPSSTRVQMRVLVEKCIKRFGFERLDSIFPIGSKKFLLYCNRMLKREEKKAERELQKREDQRRNEFDQLFLGLNMHQGDGEDAAEDLLEAGALSNFVSKHTAPRFPQLAPDHDDDDEDDNMHLDITHDGKVRIISVEEKRREDELKRRQMLAERLLGKNTSLYSPDAMNAGAQSRPGGNKKRGRDDAEDLENEELMRRYGSKTAEEASKIAAERFNRQKGKVGPSVNQITKMRDAKEEKRAFKRMRMEEDIKKGEEFQGTGGGDIRRGNIEPYAYVPLNRRYMNKRHARQALQRFETIAKRNVKGEKAKALDSVKKNA
ncbi:ribosomal rRNA-processing protein 12 [Angomonas deanei]|nr:ribosomal rRNA-processing protein 12 [Angomonas deanei]|eukprot:EPY24775.1 ribosomal rRNA-processing protein 12 [Angomonas deanei]